MPLLVDVQRFGSAYLLRDRSVDCASASAEPNTPHQKGEGGEGGGLIYFSNSIESIYMYI